MLLPEARGPIGRDLLAAMRANDPSAVPSAAGAPADPVTDDDLQLSLWVLFELHYRGFEDVAESWEWKPAAIALRRDLETQLLDALRRDAVVPASRRSVPERLRELVENDNGPQLSAYVQRDADHREFTEFAVHRSIYQLKEADPHSWALPRLDGRAKAALVEIQTDEYGRGDLARQALGAVPQDVAFAGARRHLRRLPRRRPGRHPRPEQRHVALRPASRTAGRARRSSRGVRDDVVRSVPALCEGLAAPRW